jgi:hypothetical protein
LGLSSDERLDMLAAWWWTAALHCYLRISFCDDGSCIDEAIVV